MQVAAAQAAPLMRAMRVGMRMRIVAILFTLLLRVHAARRRYFDARCRFQRIDAFESPIE